MPANHAALTLLSTGKTSSITRGRGKGFWTNSLDLIPSSFTYSPKVRA